MTLPLDSSQRHIQQAKHNEELLHESCFPDPCTTESIPYLDWNITISFYVALHYIQCYLHKKGFRTVFQNHIERNDYLKNVVSIKDSKVNQILADYIVLYRLSCRYRYIACQYYYPNQKIACDYAKFALHTLPETLEIV